MNGRKKDYPYPADAGKLIRVYVPDAEELSLMCDFGELYAIACERAEAAAEALEIDCKNAAMPLDIPISSLEEVGVPA